MASVDITNEAAQSLLSNHILHHDISPKQLFDVGTIDKNGKTSKWHIIIKHFKIIQDLLDITGGHVIKHAKFLEQFIIWLGQHNIVWSWQDSDRAVQHLRCMLRTLREKSLPPSLAPKGHGQLQILIDKFIVARESCSTADDLQVVPIPAKETKTFHVDSDGDDASTTIDGIRKSDIVKTESDTEIDEKAFFTPTRARSELMDSTKKIAPIVHRFRSVQQFLPQFAAPKVEDTVLVATATASTLTSAPKLLNAKELSSLAVSSSTSTPKLLNPKELEDLADQGSAAPRPIEYAKKKSLEKQEKAIRKLRLWKKRACRGSEWHHQGHHQC